jgi:uncharacterized protein (DUF433 family)
LNTKAFLRPGKCHNSNYTQASFQLDKVIGRYIITDPKICDGKPVFRGTRIMVEQVLEQVTMGMALEAIVDEWRGRVSKEAISEAVGMSEQ